MPSGYCKPFTGVNPFENLNPVVVEEVEDIPVAIEEEEEVPEPIPKPTIVVQAVPLRRSARIAEQQKKLGLVQVKVDGVQVRRSARNFKKNKTRKT